MEEMGLNSYLYAPKDDYKHRLFWREKYSLDESGWYLKYDSVNYSLDLNLVWKISKFSS